MLKLRRGGFLADLLSVQITTTKDRAKAERSRFTWGPYGDDAYQLRVLGVLNGLFGLTVYFLDNDEDRRGFR